MSDLAIHTDQLPQAPGQPDKPLKVTGKLKRALDLMVWECKSDNEAAVSVGMHVLSIRLALDKPHVRAYYRAQREVLRSRESAKNIHRLIEIRDKADNMPAVQAIRMLEQLGDESQARSSAYVQAPGLLIQIINPPAPGPIDTRLTQQQPQIIENDDGSST